MRNEQIHVPVLVEVSGFDAARLIRERRTRERVRECTRAVAERNRDRSWHGVRDNETQIAVVIHVDNGDSRRSAIRIRRHSDRRRCEKTARAVGEQEVYR